MLFLGDCALFARISTGTRINIKMTQILFVFFPAISRLLTECRNKNSNTNVVVALLMGSFVVFVVVCGCDYFLLVVVNVLFWLLQLLAVIGAVVAVVEGGICNCIAVVAVVVKAK